MTRDPKQPRRLEKKKNMSFTVVDRGTLGIQPPRRQHSGDPPGPGAALVRCCVPRCQRRVVNLQRVVTMRLPSPSLMRPLRVTVYLVFLANVTRGSSVATWVLEL